MILASSACSIMVSVSRSRGLWFCARARVILFYFRRAMSVQGSQSLSDCGCKPEYSVIYRTDRVLLLMLLVSTHAVPPSRTNIVFAQMGFVQSLPLLSVRRFPFPRFLARCLVAHTAAIPQRGETEAGKRWWQWWGSPSIPNNWVALVFHITDSIQTRIWVVPDIFDVFFLRLVLLALQYPFISHENQQLTKYIN